MARLARRYVHCILSLRNFYREVADDRRTVVRSLHVQMAASPALFFASADKSPRLVLCRLCRRGQQLPSTASVCT
jgi:hypothetical protein